MYLFKLSNHSYSIWIYTSFLSLQGFHDFDVQTMKEGKESEADKHGSVAATRSEDKDVQNFVTRRTVPPPGNGQKIYEIDPLLKDHRTHLDYRWDLFLSYFFLMKMMLEAIGEEWFFLIYFTEEYVLKYHSSKWTICLPILPYIIQLIFRRERRVWWMVLKITSLSLFQQLFSCKNKFLLDFSFQQIKFFYFYIIINALDWRGQKSWHQKLTSKKIILARKEFSF